MPNLNKTARRRVSQKINERAQSTPSVLSPIPEHLPAPEHSSGLPQTDSPPSGSNPKKTFWDYEIKFAFVLFAIALGWDMSGLSPNIILACVLWLVSTLLLGHAYWRLSSIISPYKKGAVISAVFLLIALLSWQSIYRQYRIEYVHDTFPFVTVLWNPTEKNWVLTVSGRGSKHMHNLNILAADMTSGLNYARQSNANGQSNPANPSELWMHQLQVSELTPEDQGSIKLITAKPMPPMDVPSPYIPYEFYVKMTSEDTQYEEIFVVEKSDKGWRTIVRLVDYTHHLNLVDCRDPEVPYGGLVPLKLDPPCVNGFITQIRPWENWQQVPDWNQKITHWAF
jgi:hypothetical protein